MTIFIQHLDKQPTRYLDRRRPQSPGASHQAPYPLSSILPRHTMPESHKAERARVRKANKAAGLGDENGRMPARVKAEAIMGKCTICSQELKITKTNTELKRHAENKHGKALGFCFPDAEKIAGDLANKSVKGGSKGGSEKQTQGKSKAQQKKDAAAGLDDLLSAGLSGVGKKAKGGKK